MAFPKKSAAEVELPALVEEPIESVESQPLPSKRIGKKPLLIAVVLLTLVTALLLAAWLWHRSSRLSPGDDTHPSAQATPTPEPEEPSFTVAVVGYGGAGHEGSYLTDSMLVARILLEQKRIVLLSLPRDLWVTIQNKDGKQQQTKINGAYILGGPDEFKRVLAEVSGWKIDKYVGIDFDGFTQAIDQLGGVDLNVERTFDDFEYPITGRETMICEEMKAEDGSILATPSPAATDGAMSVADEVAAGKLVRETLPENVKKYPCRFEHLHFDAGQQTLTGVQALKYARSRHSLQDGSDFGRSRRQQLLVQAVVEKVFRVNFIAKIPQVLSTLRSHIATDMSTLEIAEWLTKAPEVRGYPLTALSLTNDNYVQNGTSSDRQFILEPVAGGEDWSQIQNWLLFATNPRKKLQSPVIELQVSPRARSVAEAWKTALQNELHLPVHITNDTRAAAPATGAATLVPLVLGIDQSVLENIARVLSATIDTPATKSATINGPHLRVLLKNE